MSTKVNMSRLAGYCNVSESTISRVFNEKSNEKEETREQILAAVVDQILMLRDRPETANRKVGQLLGTTLIERNSVKNLL